MIEVNVEVSDKYRILFIGDSYTEGVGVEYKDTFVGLIDSALFRSLPNSLASLRGRPEGRSPSEKQSLGVSE